MQKVRMPLQGGMPATGLYTFSK